MLQGHRTTIEEEDKHVALDVGQLHFGEGKSRKAAVGPYCDKKLVHGIMVFNSHVDELERLELALGIHNVCYGG